MLGRIPSEHDEAPFNPQRLIPALDSLLDENGPALTDSRILLCLPARTGHVMSAYSSPSSPGYTIGWQKYALPAKYG